MMVTMAAVAMATHVIRIETRGGDGDGDRGEL